MRTTLTIDDDVLAAAKAIAEREKRPIGEVVSELARRSLHRPAPAATRHGIPLLPAKIDAKPVTLEIVNRLRDEIP
jgi:hypothetical protein